MRPDVSATVVSHQQKHITRRFDVYREFFLTEKPRQLTTSAKNLDRKKYFHCSTEKEGATWTPEDVYTHTLNLTLISSSLFDFHRGITSTPCCDCIHGRATADLRPNPGRSQCNICFSIVSAEVLSDWQGSRKAEN